MKARTLIQHVKQVFGRGRPYRPLFGSARTKLVMAVAMLSIPAGVALSTVSGSGGGSSMGLHHNDVIKPAPAPAGPDRAPDTQTNNSVTLHATTQNSAGQAAEPEDTGGSGRQGDSGASSMVRMEVNGKHIDVPANGTVHRTFTSDGNQSTIDISVDNRQTSSNSSNSSMNFTVEQRSNSTTDEP